MAQTIDLLKNTSFESKLDALTTAITNNTPISPTVNLSKADSVTTLSITDAHGTHTVQINDGEGVGDMQKENFATINPTGGFVDAAINSLQLGGVAASQYATREYVGTEIENLEVVTTGSVGAANGVASLGADGKIPSSQLPSYVDDVLEYDTESYFPLTGEVGKIYVDKSSNKTFRWSGTQYVVIGSSLALGTVTGSAFDGANGQAAYTHAVTNKGSEFTSGLYKITTNAEGHVIAATPVVKADITDLGIPEQDTTVLTSMTGTLTVTNGGTGATTAAEARTNLGLGTLATKDGVERTDLVAGVQTSLGLADTAIQSVTKEMVTGALGYTPVESDVIGDIESILSSL